MSQKKILDKNLLAIIKLYLYENGIYVQDDLYEELHKSEYNGYRTTSGLFTKIGGTLTFEEFSTLMEEDYNGLAIDYDRELSYKDYLENREYATTPILKLSSLSDEQSNRTYFVLDTDEMGNFILRGQYIDSNNEKHQIILNDIGVFKQGNYDDAEAVVVQAGGIRARASICGKNCISGCSFCTFSKEAKDYKHGTFTDEKLYKYIKPLIEKVVTEDKVTQLFITGGNPALEDMMSWTTYLKETIRFFKEALAVNELDYTKATIDIMLTPRTKFNYVGSSKEDRKREYGEYIKEIHDYATNLGFTTLTMSPNIEIWEQENLDRYCPSSEYNRGATKSDIGHEGYIDFIEEAVNILGPFNVRSAVIVGLEDIETTKDAIRTLINKGCYVTLSPFMPPECARYAVNLPSKSPSVESLLELSDYLEKTTLQYLKTLSAEDRIIAIKNISVSLNSHNTHNTTNINGEISLLDRIEQEGLKMGFDKTIVTSVNELVNDKGNDTIKQV